MKRPMTLLMALMMTTTALFAGVTADDHEDDTGGASWGADALMYAQDHIDAYSDSNHSQPAFDLATAFNLTVASDGGNVTGGLGGNWTDECDMNWPSDSYHIAVYSFVSEYVLNHGPSVGCFVYNSDLDQTYQNLAFELEDGWNTHIANNGHGGFGMTEEEAHAFFNSTDADGNGNVTVEEFEAAYCPDGCDEETSENISLIFTVVDTDGDDNVTWNEWREYVVEGGDQEDGMTPEYLMALFDSDDDGYISYEEMIYAMNEMAEGEIDDSMLTLYGSVFNASDEDGDGCDVDELWAFWETLMEMSGPSLEELFGVMDLNEDGFLDYQEVIDAINAGNEADGEPLLTDEQKIELQDIFDDSDLDEDGLISPDEFEAFWDAVGFGGEDDGPSPDVMFAICNADDDDYLTSTEIIDCLNDMRESDGESVMSAEEESHIQSLIESADADADGVLDLQEFEAFWDGLNDDGGGDDGGGCPFESDDFCMETADICDDSSEGYDGVACGEAVAHFCADGELDGVADPGCDIIIGACEAGDMPADLCEAFMNFDHDDYHDSDGDGVHDDVDLCPDGDDMTDVDGDAVPDACDDLIDSDGDDVGDDVDDFPNDPCAAVDTDGDGNPDYVLDGENDPVPDCQTDLIEDDDDDNDGVWDAIDCDSLDPTNDRSSTDDHDNDGVADDDCNEQVSASTLVCPQPYALYWVNPLTDNGGYWACGEYASDVGGDYTCPSPSVLGMGWGDDGLSTPVCITPGGDNMPEPLEHSLWFNSLPDDDGDGIPNLYDDSDSTTSDNTDDSDKSGDEEDDDDKGRLPGFTFVMTLTAMMGALLLAGRRKV